MDRVRLLFPSNSGNVGVFLIEALDAPCGVNEFLLPGEKGMATRADFYAQHVTLDRRAGRKGVAAGAVHRHRVVVGMNTGFHGSPSVVSGLHGAPSIQGLQPRR